MALRSTLQISGVPHGYVFGPLLFLIYINDIVQEISLNVRLYADDCIVYSSIVSNYDVCTLQKNLDSIQQWCVTWKNMLNSSKFKYVMFFFMRKSNQINSGPLWWLGGCGA